MTWGMVGAAAVSVVGGAIARNQANKSAKGAANAMTDAQRAQYEQTRSDLMPYMDFGKQALGGLGALNNGDYSGFLNSPDYQAALGQGLNAIDHRAAARGGLFGGGNTRDAIQFGSGLASQYLGNYRNSLFQQAGMGQNAAAGVGAFGQNAANQIGNAQSGYFQQRGDNNAQFAAGLAGVGNGLLQNYMARGSSYQPQGQPTYTGLGGAPNFGQPAGISPFTAQGAAKINGYGWYS